MPGPTPLARTRRPAARTPLRLAACTAAAALLALFSVPTAAQAKPTSPSPATFSVRVISLNDLHGNLKPPTGSSGRVVLDDGSTVDAGGAAYLATHLKTLQAEAPRSFVVSAGDNIGASPLISALFHDEPTIDFLNSIGLTASAVGNHEFDEGYQELKRIQFGGCHPVDGCQFDQPYAGARFPYLGANVTFAKNHKPALLPFTVKFENGVPIGIIGVTLHDLPTIVVPSGIKGLAFGDEVAAIDKTSALLQRLGVKAQIVVMHQGDGTESGNGPNECAVVPGIAQQIAQTASANVDAFFAGHSHQQYNCTVTDPKGHQRPIIQGASFGRLLSVVDLTIDRRTRDVVRDKTVTHNEVVTRDVTPDPATQALVDRAASLSAPIAGRQVGRITADITRAPSPAGEEPLGDVIADAQLAATQAAGAQIAMTNQGGIRADLTYLQSGSEGDGVVTYEEAFTVQPFSNYMQTLTLTGAQLKDVLEQQWQPQPSGVVITRFLQVSAGFTYSWSASAAIGSKISDIKLNGTPIDPAASYRVSVNNFLAGGGDSFTVFTSGTDVTGGGYDVDALVAYLTAQSPVSPPPASRVTVVV